MAAVAPTGLAVVPVGAAVVPIEAVLVPTVAAAVRVGAEALAKFAETAPAVFDSVQVVGAEKFAVVEWVQFAATAAVAVVMTVAAEVFVAVVAIADLFEQVAIDPSEIVVVIVTAAEEAVSLPETGLSVVESYEVVALVAALIVPAAALAAVEDK